MELNNLKMKQRTPFCSWMVDTLFFKETVCFKTSINPVLGPYNHRDL